MKSKDYDLSVLVDGQYQDIETGATGVDGVPIKEKQYFPLSAEMLKKVDNLVKQAVGYSASRGDIITVENIKFAQPDEDLAEVLKKSEMTNQLWQLTEWFLGYFLPLL